MHFHFAWFLLELTTFRACVIKDISTLRLLCHFANTTLSALFQFIISLFASFAVTTCFGYPIRFSCVCFSSSMFAKATNLLKLTVVTVLPFLYRVGGCCTRLLILNRWAATRKSAGPQTFAYFINGFASRMRLSNSQLWSRPWGVARLLGLRGLPPCPHPSKGVG